MSVVVNQSELAKIFGVSAVTINAWQTEGLPVAIKGVRGSPNTYDTAKVIKWYAARVSGKSEETQKDRLSRVQADRIEMEMAEARGALIPVADIAPAWEGVAIAIRRAMLAVPSVVAPLIVQTNGEDAARELVQEAIEDALTKLSEPDERGIVGPGAVDAGDAGAAAEDAAIEVGRGKPATAAGKRTTGKVPVLDDAVLAGHS